MATVRRKAPAKKAEEKAAPAGLAPISLGGLTPEEQAIAQRVAGENREWETIGEESAIDFSLMQDTFRLPEEAQKLQREKRFAFRWIERRKERIDQIRNKPVPLKWWICNSANTPFLKKYIDPVLGAVIREDQILMFRPWWMHEKENNIKAGMANALDQTKRLDALQGKQGGGAEMQVSQRSLESGAPSRLEVKGSDIVYGDEADMDAAAGIVHSEMSDSELIINE